MDMYKILQDWVNEVQKDAMIHISHKNRQITICTEYPGYFIGPRGETFNKYTKDIKSNGYTVTFLEAHEHLKPGRDWHQIELERAKAFFETEYDY